MIRGNFVGARRIKKKGDLLMGKVSYTAHISNKKSGITSKSKLQGVAKHHLIRVSTVMGTLS